MKLSIKKMVIVIGCYIICSIIGNGCVLALNIDEVLEARKQVEGYLRSKNYEEVIKICESKLDIKDLPNKDEEFFVYALKRAKESIDKKSVEEGVQQAQDYIKSHEYYKAIDLCEKMISMRSISFEQREMYITIQRDAIKKFSEYQDKEKRKKYKELVNAKLYNEAVSFCKEQIENSETSPSDSLFFSKEQQNLIKTHNEYIENKLEEKVESLLKSRLFDDAILLCEEYGTASFITKENKMRISRLIENIDESQNKHKVDVKIVQIQELIDEKKYSQAKVECEFLINQGGLSNQEKKLLQEFLLKINRNALEYWECNVKSVIENGMEGKMYVEVIEYCERALEDLILPKEDLEYVKKTKEEAQEKYDECRTANTIAQMKNHMSNKMYIEVIQLCDTELQKGYVEEANQKIMKEIRDEAQNKYDEYRQSNTTKVFNQIEEYMSKGLYLETVNVCDAEEKKPYISKNDAIKLGEIKREAQDRYNKYITNEIFKKVNAYMDSGLYLETIALCNQSIENSHISMEDKNRLKEKTNEATEKYKDYLEKEKEAFFEELSESGKMDELVDAILEANERDMQRLDMMDKIVDRTFDIMENGSITGGFFSGIIHY